MNYSLKPLRINLQWRAILGFLLVKSLLIASLAIFYQYSQKRNLYQQLVNEVEVSQLKFSEHRKVLASIAQYPDRSDLQALMVPILVAPEIQIQSELNSAKSQLCMTYSLFNVCVCVCVCVCV